MLLLNEIQEDYSIRKQVVETEAFSEDTEMSEHDSVFLCGLLKSVQPRKILEVGVAGGGDNGYCITMSGMHRKQV